MFDRKTILIGVGISLLFVLLVIFVILPIFIPSASPTSPCFNPKIVSCKNFDLNTTTNDVKCSSNADCSWDGMRDSCYPDYVEVPRCAGLVYECRNGYCVSYAPLGSKPYPT
ncbi:Uncharacterised protein [Candidatus Bilamarchaeum dharawalense]|uniref:Uncharacterized protein n=1 Tax=Candidatus Bilamarchaeum dharawalense TaxID=2885759 RepID=A0A5E4LRR3_9ARCH|nr:Uncharacterised protein [Candidatus Bilamarchaeum dharawalense]